MDVTQLNLPSLGQLLLDEKTVWEKANQIGKTLRSWPEEEADIRHRYAELQSMSEEDRDKALVQGHLERAGMLEKVLSHIDSVLMPLAKAREAAKKKKRPKSKAKKKRSRR